MRRKLIPSCKLDIHYIMLRNTKHSSNLYILTCILFLFRAGKISCGGFDTLSTGKSLTPTETLISTRRIFELGFFQPSRSNQNQYLGIWYIGFPKRKIVWVANRESPILPASTASKFLISPNGNLELSNDSHTFWSTDATTTTINTVEALLRDDGNLILREVSRPTITLWQSFDHPTDTWLPEASIGLGRIQSKRTRLVSWRRTDDPTPGMFSVEIPQLKDQTSDQLLMIWNSLTIYWKSGSWNGYVFASAQKLIYFLTFKFVHNENGTYCYYSVLNNNVFSMLVINATGHLEQVTSLRSNLNWSTTLSYPGSPSGMCGKFGIWSDDPVRPCVCLKGFNWPSEDWSSDCSRKTPLECGTSNNVTGKGNNDGFVEVPNIKFPFGPKTHSAKSGKGCESACLQSCSCTAYAFGDSECSIWEGDLFGILSASNKRHLHLKLAHSDVPKGKSKILEVIIGILVPSIVVVFGGGSGLFLHKEGQTKRLKMKESGEDLLCFDFSYSNYSAKPNDDGTILRNRTNKDFDLPIFSYASVSAATNNFSPDNKLGEGGFGAVYKGNLLNGQEIAMKRLSKNSGQGFEEFRNEIVLIAKLQHKNLVRLLGCCMDTDESILVYEYMHNKSLDFFLFDSNKQELLDWETRVRIVEGVAQGLLYLHEYSRLRIIHRDLKAGNILLDGEMNPKISDFGLARIFGGNGDSRTRTNRIVGTYGYMAPEYALEGLFSVKSDVFSFGVLVLEIVSGKKNTGFYQTDSLNLLGHAWELWISDRGVELMDPAIGCPPVSAVLKYINVGLLCVQENPTDRPIMSSVISMLGNEVIAPLPAPKKPAFSFSTRNVTNSSIVNCSVNGLTVSMIKPR